MHFSPLHGLVLLASAVRGLPSSNSKDACPKALVDVIKSLPQGAGAAYCSSLLSTRTTATATATSYVSTATLVSTVSKATTLPQVTVTSTSTVTATDSTMLTIPTTYTSTATAQLTENVAATTEVSTSTSVSTTTVTVSSSAVIYPSPHIDAATRKRTYENGLEPRSVDLPTLLCLTKAAVFDLCLCLTNPTTVTTTATQTVTAVKTTLSTTTTTSTSKPPVTTVPATTTLTMTETATTYTGPVETITTTSTVTSYYTSSTSTTVTSIATATAAAYQYSLLYDQDNCAITPAHIVDYSMPGVTEQQAIDNCMQTCTADNNCLAFEAYFVISNGGDNNVPRCATFGHVDRSTPYKCPVPGYNIGYSVIATRNF